MSTKIEKSDFSFLFSGYGHYRVTYKSPVTGRMDDGNKRYAVDRCNEKLRRTETERFRNP